MLIDFEDYVLIELIFGNDLIFLSVNVVDISILYNLKMIVDLSFL